MKLKHIFGRMFGVLAVAGLTLAMGACTEEPDYEKAATPAGIQAYFSNTLGSKVELSKTASSFSVTVSRSTSEDPAIINLNSSCNYPGYDIPGTVSFDKGESTASIVIGYNNRQAYEEWATITLTVGDEESTTPYGDTSYTFKAGIPAPWTSIGMATFCDGLISGSYGLSVIPYSVEIQENDLKKGLYRLVEPWGERAPYFNLGAYDNSVARYLEINACDPEGVYIPTQESGFMLSQEEGFITVSSTAAYNLENGATLEDCKANGICGTLEDGIITFPANGLLIQIAPGLYYADPESAFKVAMPGVEIKDYMVSLSYKGILTDPDNAKSVLASLTLGEDADLARVAVISQKDDVYQAIDAIDNGTLEYIECYENGDISLKCPSTPGDYFILAVSYAGGEAREAAVDGFKVKGDGGKIATLEDYLGDYTVTGYYEMEDPNTGKPVPVEDEFPVRFVKGTEELQDGTVLDVVKMEGLLGMEGYTSPVSFIFNPEDGTLDMVRYLCEPFDTGDSYGECDVMFSPTDPEGYLLLNEDRVYGELTADGNVEFVNSSKNKRKYDTMVFLLVLDWNASDGITLFSPFYQLNFNSYLPDGQAKRNASQRKISMKFTRVDGKKFHADGLDKNWMESVKSSQLGTRSAKGNRQIAVRGLERRPTLVTSRFK